MWQNDPKVIYGLSTYQTPHA